MKNHIPLLFLATISCPGVADAQIAGQTSGSALNVASYSPVDSNGVDLLTGRLLVSSPRLSMGNADDPVDFYFTWQGRGWLVNTPHMYLDKDWHIVVEYDGISDEFADPVQVSDGDNTDWGHQYVYTQKRPNTGANLACFWTGGITGNGWLDYCSYKSRQGVIIVFAGMTPFNGGYPTGVQYDFEQYGNTRMWPYWTQDPMKGKFDYIVQGPTTGNGTNGGLIKISAPGGISVQNVQSYYANAINFVMTNNAAAAATPGRTQTLLVQTPSLNNTDRTKSYLRPINTMQSWTDPTGAVSNYTFNKSGDMTTIVSPAGMTITVTYDTDHRVKTYTVGGRTWNYSYNFADNSTGSGTTTVTNPDSTSKSVSHLRRPGPVSSVTDENGRTTTYSVDSFDRMSLVTKPEGDTLAYTYDPRGNLSSSTATPKPGSGLAPQVTTASYPSTCTAFAQIATCNKPTQIVDPRGNATDITYSAPVTNYTGGWPATVMEPADSNGVRPIKRYTYIDRANWELRSGTWVKVGGAKTVIASMKTCRISATVGDACAGGTADEIVTTYDYGPDTGPDNLLLRGVVVTADGVSRRTCFSYDVTGNKISETTPRAGLAVCQ